MTASHDCDGGAPIQPTGRFLSQHKRAGSDPCEWAKRCSQWGAWVQSNPDRDRGEWPGFAKHGLPAPGKGRGHLRQRVVPSPRREARGHDCEADPAVPESTVAFYSAHRKAGEEPCDFSRACSGLYRWNRNHPDGPEYPGWAPKSNRSKTPPAAAGDQPPLTERPTQVHVYVFPAREGADWCYVGITALPGRVRHNAGYSPEMDRWLKEGRPHTRTVIASLPTREEALRTETMLIRLLEQTGMRMLNSNKRLRTQDNGPS